MGWRERVLELVHSAPVLQAPDARFQIRPPAVEVRWEPPGGGTLSQFYALCDGGVFPDEMGWGEFFPRAEIVPKSRALGEKLAAILERQERTSPFVPGRHFLFGGDATGRVLRLWDADADALVGYMPLDDHDWVEPPDSPSLDDFFEEFFSTRPYRRVIGSAVSEWWMKVLGS